MVFKNTNSADIPPIHRKFAAKKGAALLITTVSALVVSLYAAGIGSVYIPVNEILQAIFGRGDAQTQTVILNIRMPRVISAILVGGILASSGAVMQCVLRNPLASSSTLGVSQGAAFGAALGISVFSAGMVSSSSANTVTIENPYLVTLCAFVGGSVSSLVVIAISRLKKEIGPSGLVLAGVALSSLFSGGSTLLQYFADETQIGAIVFWTFGNLGGTNWREILFLLVVFSGSLLYFLLNRWNYNAMESGAETAKSLGVNTKAVTLVSMLVCSLAAAAAVSFVGIIGFVGLIAPHIMRRFTGNDYRYLIPCSAAAGSLLLVLADTFGRTVMSPVILPIGAITSFLGAPMFLFILFKGVKTHG